MFLEMGSGDFKHHLNFHLHIPHHRGHGGHGHHGCGGHGHGSHHHGKEILKDIPKGCLAILVGHEGEEKLQRFIIPVIYINHPLFLQLLKEAEEEYGFDQKGPITIPCNVEEFRNVQYMIDREQLSMHHLHHPHHHFLCFKA
ncbi:hypothetical protein Nepgr_010677 [Nepenthes gracilis]|uniref:Uncharacterized protein n=1 Tax=Nepenthes gracilis TaxID=150966 RepID=A0AAD3SDW1_NEPGR|nr:hypothetical protein Nepgr_010677 [Nepenthes gracilis]